MKNNGKKDNTKVQKKVESNKNFDAESSNQNDPLGNYTNRPKSTINSTAQNKAESVAKAFVTDSSYQNDPLGCYTGKAKGTDERPEQDHDDL